MLLKRTLFCGILWCLGSLQHLAQGGSPVFVATLLLGVAECFLSVRYRQKYRAPAAAILSIQSLYYGGCFVWSLFAPEVLLKVSGAVLSACMLAVVLSALHSVLKRS